MSPMEGADPAADPAADLDAGGEPEWAGRQWDAHLRNVSLHGRGMRYLDIGDGPTVLLVHGLGASWQVWYRNIADLSRDHRVLAVDLPGFGLSEALGRSTGILGYSQALEALLERLGVDRTLVVGHSLGGLIAQSLANRSPDGVAGLMIVCSGDGLLSARQQAAFRGMALFSTMFRYWGPPAFLLDPALRGLLSVAPLRRRLMSRVVHDPAGITPALATVMMATALRSPALADAIRAGLRGDIEPHRIGCPTLVLAGAHDRMVPEIAGRRLAAAIPAARYEVWPDVGHHPMLERSAEFNDRLRAFSTEVSRAA